MRAIDDLTTEELREAVAYPALDEGFKRKLEAELTKRLNSCADCGVDLGTGTCGFRRLPDGKCELLCLTCRLGPLDDEVDDRDDRGLGTGVGAW